MAKLDAAFVVQTDGVEWDLDIGVHLSSVVSIVFGQYFHMKCKLVDHELQTNAAWVS